MPKFSSATDIINQVALEVGLVPVPDPYSSEDGAFLQLVGYLTTVGKELAEEYPWQKMVLEHTFVTDAASFPEGDYPLPDDFLYMIDQTGWNRTEQLPLGGPLTSQDWSYVIGRGLVSFTIYASFRLNEGVFKLFPQPPNDGQEIAYEYMSRNWVADSGSVVGVRDAPLLGSDTVLYEPLLIERGLKTAYLDAKGFDTMTSQASFDSIFRKRTGRDKGAPILNAGRRGRQYPYLDTFRNTPDTNFGL